MKWAYGVTTIPDRAGDLLPRTLASLERAGFPEPHLFVDGGTEPVLYEGLGRELTMRQTAVGMFGNWVLALWELYLLYPGAARFALFEDDVLFCRNLRQYLERLPYREKSYLNLYSIPRYEQRATATGFYPSDQMGKGALALVFDLPAAEQVLKAQTLAGHVESSTKWRVSRDGAIMRAMKSAGWKEYIHNPSLVQHVGTASTKEGKPLSPVSETFPGEDFDAMELLQEGRP